MNFYNTKEEENFKQLWPSPLGTYQRSAMSRIKSCSYFLIVICIHTFFLISYSYYTYAKFEVLIVLILNNTYDVVDFDSP